MTLDSMYDEMSLFGFDDFENSQKLLLLNEAYFDIVTREPWPFLEGLIEFTAPSGTTQISTSNGNIKVDKTSNLLVPNATTNYDEYFVNSVLSFTDISHNVIMIPERTDVVEKNYKINNLNVYPERYYFVDDNMFVYPPVEGNTQYRLFYIKKPIAATTTSDTFLIPERHHSIIVYGALVKAFLVNDDPQAAAFQNMYEQRYQQMRNDAWMNQYDRTDRIHVLTDNYDWNY